MPKVRLSGTVEGPKDPNRADRARLLYLLFKYGWDIYNSNGDQRITLSNVERKIVESDAFVFTPGATIEDLFKAVSIFVGYQTLDRNLAGKPTVILNSDGSWNTLFDLLRDLERLGTISQNHEDYLLTAREPESVLDLLEEGLTRTPPVHAFEKFTDQLKESFDNDPPADHEGSVCVFCSATTRHLDYIAEGHELGEILAQNHLGCVSGAGRSGIMGAVVRGVIEGGGWAAGSNVPHIIELEGLPDGLSSFWLRPDIYTRMEVMIQRSDAFVIMPGGAGTLQEMLALMIFKAQRNPLMEGKPVVVYNRLESDGVRFWDKLLGLLHQMGVPEMFSVVNNLKDVVPAARTLMKGVRAV